MPHRKCCCPQIRSQDSDSTAIFLDTDIGQLKAGWETCQSRSSNPTDSSEAVSVLKCLGIPYGRIPYRWAAPRKATLPWREVRDCTKFGPQCPQAKDVLFDIDDLPVFGRVGKDSFAVQGDSDDEFSCLNLNIFAPLDIVRDGKPSVEKLPVFVWVHGGAYWTGSGGVDLYDGSELVARSMRINSPIIVVTCNYRLGVLGFLHSRELALDAALQDDVPRHFRSTANLGLLDVYKAFEWVKNHIATFGGDPQNITGIGESAGAVILSYFSLFKHLNVKIPRMILSSSTVFSNHALLASEAQTWFDAICEKSGIPPNTEDPVSALRKMSVGALVASSNFARNGFRPIWDDITITYDPRRVLDDPSLWDDVLEQIVFGHCENESWLRLACFPSTPPTTQRTIVGRVPPVHSLREKAKKLYSISRAGRLKWYNGPQNSRISDSALCWMGLEGHARYYAVTQLLSKSFITSRSSSNKLREAYKYIFSWTPSQWPPGWPSTHTADILSTFLHRRLSSKDNAVSCTFADQLILFAAGRRERMEWRQFDLENPLFNVLTRLGEWELMEEGSGEFGLDEESILFWKEVVGCSIEAGQKGWTGISR